MDPGCPTARPTSRVVRPLSGSGLHSSALHEVEATYSSRRATGAVDRGEWIDQIRTVSTATSDYFVQESLHPNYWGELAVRSCLRQAWNGGTPRSGTCTTSGTGLVDGEPRMTLN
jgi:hypothetical protein